MDAKLTSWSNSIRLHSLCLLGDGFFDVLGGSLVLLWRDYWYDVLDYGVMLLGERILPSTGLGVGLAGLTFSAFFAAGTSAMVFITSSTYLLVGLHTRPERRSSVAFPGTLFLVAGDISNG